MVEDREERVGSMRHGGFMRHGSDPRNDWEKEGERSKLVKRDGVGEANDPRPHRDELAG